MSSHLMSSQGFFQIVTPSYRLLIVTALLIILCSCCRLLGRLLLLILILDLRLLCQGLLQDLENFLVCDLLIRLELGQIWAWWCGKFLKTILCDSLQTKLASTHPKSRISRCHLTNCGQQSSNRLRVLVTDNLILPEDIASDTLYNTNFCISLVFQLP